MTKKKNKKRKFFFLLGCLVSLAAFLGGGGGGVTFPILSTKSEKLFRKSTSGLCALDKHTCVHIKNICVYILCYLQKEQSVHSLFGR